MITLVLGGVRSGKSRFAQELARKLSPSPVYLATSRTWDDDHRARIARHVQDRGEEWTTLEVEKQLSSVTLQERVIVVDCVTLWLANWFSDSGSNADVALEQAKHELDKTIDSTTNTWIFVSNEIGQGVHAETVSGRKFTDLQGFLNQHIASVADTVVLMVAGIPLPVKGRLPEDVA
ncbi:MAG TPA: bifunctional adenosylcobinamide kinase/adenosylcobinamide-phosphate guanylyltransferase [Polyangiaceae bacterium]